MSLYSDLNEVLTPYAQMIKELKAGLGAQTAVVFGNPDNTFPFTFECGTYYSTTVGQALQKYTGGGYDKTRKVVSTTVTNVTITTVITAKADYQFAVFVAENGIIKSKAEQQTEYTLESGKQYGIVLRPVSDSTDISAVSVDDIIEVEYKSKTDTTLTQEGVPADSKAVGDKLGKYDNIINSVLIEYTNIDFYGQTWKKVIIASSTGKWQSGSNKSSYLVPRPESAFKVAVTANDTQVTVFAMLTDNESSHGGLPHYATGSGRTMIAAGETQEFDIPDDCQYFYFLRKYDSTVYTPDDVTLSAYAEIGKVDIIPLGLHEMPKSRTALNIVKRCRQLTDIKWTPAVDLKRFMSVQRKSPVPSSAEAEEYTGTFKEGVEYTGVPYGRVLNTMRSYGYSHATVGHYIGFDTFISSVSNAKSKLCLDKSGSAAGHTSVIYATVCSGLTCYALDVDEVATNYITSIDGLDYVGKINDNGTLLNDKAIQIGDVLNLQNYHTGTVTDIIRDDEGVMQYIEISDASTAGLADKNYADGQIGGLCRRKGWTREQFYSAGSWGDYSLYRYSGDVSYTPSPYVNVGDEFDAWRTEYFPIMPYEGEGFVYNSSYLPTGGIKLVYDLDDYTYVKVFKDDVEISGSPFTLTSDSDNITVDASAVGDYKAYLCNIADGEVTNLSYACTWSIVN